MANALKRVENCRHMHKQVFKLQQEGTIRDAETDDIVKLELTAEQNREMFNLLHQMSEQLRWLEQDLRHIF